MPEVNAPQETSETQLPTVWLVAYGDRHDDLLYEIYANESAAQDFAKYTNSNFLAVEEVRLTNVLKPALEKQDDKADAVPSKNAGD